MNLKQFFKDLFQKQEKANVPIVREQLKRAASYVNAYDQWKAKGKNNAFLEKLQQSMKAYHGLASNHPDVMLLNHRASTGFIFHFGESDEKLEFSYFFDWLKERMLEMEYRTYMSDVRNFVRENHVERKERHYLKPSYRLNIGKDIAEQLFGNITIEQLFHDDQPIKIQFLCTAYRDHKFKEAKGFDELMKYVLTIKDE